MGPCKHECIVAWILDFVNILTEAYALNTDLSNSGHTEPHAGLSPKLIYVFTNVITYFCLV